MADIVDKITRSRMMAGIGARNTRPEMVLRRRLHGLGLRFRLHVKDLPGTPDLVLPKYRAVVFVHGCFWHRHPACRHAATPTTRPDFWADKFAANVARDAKVRQALLAAGWRVATAWECALRNGPSATEVTAELAAWLASGATEFETAARSD